MRRSMRPLTLAGTMAAFLVAAPTALACQLTGLSAAGGSGGAVHPGDTVTYTLLTRSTEDSPDDSAYTVNVGSTQVGAGEATPSKSGGDWSTRQTFAMPDVGSFKGSVTVSVDLATGGYMASQVQYDGTPAATQPAAQPSSTSSESSPSSTGGQASDDSTNAQPSAPLRTGPASSSSPTIAASAPTKKRATAVGERVRGRHAPARARRVVRNPGQPVAAPRLPAAVQHSATLTAITHPSLERLPATPRAAHDGRAGHRATTNFTGVHAERPSAGRTLNPHATTAPLAQTDGDKHAPRPLLVGAVSLLVLLLAAGGLAGAAVRRRRPTPNDDADSLTRDLAIEAELQEMLTEHARSEATSAADRPRAPA